jgi:cytochrome c biogenesis protein CcdA
LDLFPRLRKKFGDSVVWKEFDIGASPENMDLAIGMVFASRKTGILTPSVVVNRTVLSGRSEIESGLEGAIEQALASPERPVRKHSEQDALKVFRNMTVPVILLSGMVDGINPCAFAAIALFISLMYIYAYRKKDVIVISVSYCLAVFVTYFLVGLGLFSFIYSLDRIYSLTYFLRMTVASLCLIFAVLNIYDFFLYKKTGESNGLLLVLPDAFKKRISQVMGKHLRNNKKSGALPLAAGAFALGVAVSILEMACTGQVYLPTLVYIFKQTDHKIQALSYMLLYNLMFVLPLVTIIALYVAGVRSEAFGSFLKRNAGRIKIALAIIFATLGVGIIFGR